MDFLNKTIELLPAYGRLYKTQKSFKNDFNDRKDFLIKNGSYMSKYDLSHMIRNGTETIFIQIKYTNIYIVRFGKIQKWVNE